MINSFSLLSKHKDDVEKLGEQRMSSSRKIGAVT